MLGLATTATAFDSLQPELDGASSADMGSTVMAYDTVFEGIVSALSRYCGVSPKLVSDVSLLSASVLPAVATLCIVRVPNVSSRLHRLPFVKLCMLLLWAAVHWRVSQQGGASTTAMLSSSSSHSSVAGVYMPITYTGDSSSRAGPLGSMTVAAVPILLAVLLVQAPAALPQAGRSRAGLAAVLGLSVVLQLAAVDAAASVCASVKPVCTGHRPIVMGANVLKPATSKSPSAAPSTYSSSGSANPYAGNLLEARGFRKEALHVASHRASDPEVPQRVTPVTPNLRLSKALEQQLFTQLQMALASNSSRSNTSPALPQTKRPPTPVSTPAAPRGSLMYLTNARLRVGIDPAHGGAISHLSSPVMPAEWANKNLINTWDSGRLIQQSYYGCEDGSCWSSRPWRWNPVQGGSWHNAPPKLLARSAFGDMISTSVLPRNWGGQDLLEDVVMTTQTLLLPNMVKVRQTMRYTGDAAHPQRHQEVPAVFVDRRLNALALYNGSAPWTGGQLSFLLPGQTNEYYKMPEKWAAYVDTKSGFGVGIYTPIAEQLVAYRVGGEGSAARSDCSYMAPLVTSAIQPQSEFSYDTYIAVGRVDQLRQWFATLAATTEPALAAQRRIPPPSQPLSLRLPAAAGADPAARAPAPAAPAPSRPSFAQALPPQRSSYRVIVNTAGVQGSITTGVQLPPVKAVAVDAGLQQPALLAPMAVHPTHSGGQVKASTG